MKKNWKNSNSAQQTIKLLVISMCDFSERYRTEIKRYFEENNLSFDKVCQMGQCYGKNDLWLQYVDEEKGKNGLLDETPAPIVLKIYLDNNGDLKIEQTEHTKKYLT